MIQIKDYRIDLDKIYRYNPHYSDKSGYYLYIYFNDVKDSFVIKMSCREELESIVDWLDRNTRVTKIEYKPEVTKANLIVEQKSTNSSTLVPPMGIIFFK